MPLNESYIKSKIEVAKRKKVVSNRPGTDRLPAGQKLVNGFPVLDLGLKPTFRPKYYRFRVNGLVDEPLEFTYDELLQMPKTELTADFHCVTHWTKYDVTWGGILFTDFLEIVKPKPEWKHLIQTGLDGYTTNVPREDVERDDILIAYELEGEPLPQDHGAPVRLIVPQLYAWKGSKFLCGFKFTEEDEPGYWEVRGYHNHGDAFKEERFSDR